LILEKRNRLAPFPNSRLALVKAKLEAAHKKVGAAEVSVDGDEVVKGDFSSENLERFNSTKGTLVFTPPVRSRLAQLMDPEDESQVKPDPDAWEEPP